MQSFHDIWEPVRKALAEKFTETIMELWFNHLELAALSDTMVVLISDSDMKAEIIGKRYRDALAATFEDILGFPVEVAIVSEENRTAPIDREQLQHDLLMGLPLDAILGRYPVSAEPNGSMPGNMPGIMPGNLPDSMPFGSAPGGTAPKGTGKSDAAQAADIKNAFGTERSITETDSTPTVSSTPNVGTPAPGSTSTIGDTPAIPNTAGTVHTEPPQQNASSPLPQVQKQQLFVNSEYTFDNFIVGSSNKFAHAACVAVANNPASAYNPLFIYGPSGLGKTHLLYAIINRILEKTPNANIVYVKGDSFTNNLIESLQNKSMPAFREKYRTADILLIDDVHFIAGKESTQEEFFNTFNELYDAKKQIILTSDRPPKEINTLEDRLKTRFEWGLIADIQPPDMELRIAILRKKAQYMDVEISNEVLNFLAEKLKSNIRQIEGVIKRLGAYSNLTKQPITIDMARDNIADVVTGAEPVKVTQDKIFNAVANKYGVTVEQIKGTRKSKEIAQARHICVYIMRKITDMSLPAIGKVMGGKDHTTILYSVNLIQKRVREDALLENDIDALIKEITNQ
ncbi:MAG: chromosomal replication initiator protein DnaA [Clostridia bacterium]|nr:chromosomal replication initiator protein DnaA [Clostridia bacterium]